MTLQVLAMATIDSDADNLHGDGACESGGIDRGDSLPSNTASAGLAWER